MLRNAFYSFTIATLVCSLLVFPHKASAAESEDVAFEDLLFDEVPVVEEENLAEMRGTALSPELLGIAIFDAISANNNSSGTVSGGNIINAGAFAESSGMSTIIQNSGNNVLIQSATILNVNID